MRRGFWSSVGLLVLGGGLATAQAPAPAPATAAPALPGGSGCATCADTAASCAGACRDGLCNRCGCDLDGGLWTNRVWVNAEYVLWQLHGQVPPDISGALQGAKFDPGDLTNDLALRDFRSGVRVTAGFWLESSHCLGFEVGGLALEVPRGHFNASMTQDPSVNIANIPPRVVARLPIDPPGDLDAGDMLTSSLFGDSRSRFWMAEANVRSTRWYFGNIAFDFLAGAKYLHLDESLTFHGDFVFTEPNPDEAAPGPEDGRTVSMHTNDFVSTHNNFYGGQVGASFEWQECRWVLGGSAKFALGDTHEVVTLGGSTVLDPALIEPSAGAAFVPRPLTFLPGGLITPATLPVSTHRDHLTFIPDLNINLGYQLTENLRVYVGYNYLLVTSIARLGDQSILNPTSRTSDLSIHGANFGVQVRY